VIAITRGAAAGHAGCSTLRKSVTVRRMSFEKELELPGPPTADEVADMADRGEDISRFYSGEGKMMPPVQLKERKPTAYMKYDIVNK